MVAQSVSSLTMPSPFAGLVDHEVPRAPHARNGQERLHIDFHSDLKQLHYGYRCVTDAHLFSVGGTKTPILRDGGIEPKSRSVA